MKYFWQLVTSSWAELLSQRKTGHGCLWLSVLEHTAANPGENRTLHGVYWLRRFMQLDCFSVSHAPKAENYPFHETYSAHSNDR